MLWQKPSSSITIETILCFIHYSKCKSWNRHWKWHQSRSTECVSHGCENKILCISDLYPSHRLSYGKSTGGRQHPLIRANITWTGAAIYNTPRVSLYLWQLVGNTQTQNGNNLCEMRLSEPNRGLSFTCARNISAHTHLSEKKINITWGQSICHKVKKEEKKKKKHRAKLKYTVGFCILRNGNWLVNN